MFGGQLHLDFVTVKQCGFVCIVQAVLPCAVPCCDPCRALGKGSSNAMKAAGLKLAAAVVEGLPQTDRNMPAVQAEAWKLFEKQAKVRAHAAQLQHAAWQQDLRRCCSVDVPVDVTCLACCLW